MNKISRNIKAFNSNLIIIAGTSGTSTLAVSTTIGSSSARFLWCTCFGALIFCFFLFLLNLVVSYFPCSLSTSSLNTTQAHVPKLPSEITGKTVEEVPSHTYYWFMSCTCYILDSSHAHFLFIEGSSDKQSIYHDDVFFLLHRSSKIGMLSYRRGLEDFENRLQLLLVGIEGYYKTEMFLLHWRWVVVDQSSVKCNKQFSSHVKFCHIKSRFKISQGAVHQKPLPWGIRRTSVHVMCLMYF